MEEQFEIVVDELTEETCWRLLTRVGFGRVGFRDGDGVAVLPVNAVTNDRQVIFRTRSGTSLAGAVGLNVAFQADHIDDVAESGWSILVRGRLTEVTDPDRRRVLERSRLRPWAPGPRDQWMVIEPTTVTGRMVQRHRHLRAGHHLPYMEPG